MQIAGKISVRYTVYVCMRLFLWITYTIYLTGFSTVFQPSNSKSIRSTRSYRKLCQLILIHSTCHWSTMYGHRSSGHRNLFSCQTDKKIASCLSLCQLSQPVCYTLLFPLSKIGLYLKNKIFRLVMFAVKIVANLNLLYVCPWEKYVTTFYLHTASFRSFIFIECLVRLNQLFTRVKWQAVLSF